MSPAPSVPHPAPEPSNESPDVPGFRTWRGVYWFVFACFVVIVAALTIFSHLYA